MRSVQELIHADVFGDYLEMSAHLLDEGYKDASAVICGSTLEAHLRKLCDKHSVPFVDAAGVPLRASTLNQNLYSANIYNKIDLQSVTAWLALRNDAAHGNYAKYDKHQVANMLDGVRGLMTRFPA